VRRQRGVTGAGKRRHAAKRLPAAERREAILEAALAVFGSASYGAATTADIAAAAGISEPILYRHFESKKALYIACLEESWSRLRAAWEEARATAEPATALVAVSNATIALASGGTVLPPTLWMQAFAEAGTDEEIRAAVRKVVGDVHAVVGETLAGARRDGLVHAERDVLAEAWIVVASLMLHTLSARVGGLLEPDDVERIRVQRMRWLTGADPA
jgi:AcrR family transcriptional regulator